MSGQTSGTYNFNPPLSDIILDAYERIGLRDLDDGNIQYIQSARRSLNFVAATWANKGINLWTVELISVPLTAGMGGPSSPIPVDQGIINVLDAYRTIGGIDIILAPLSRDDYAAIPFKAQPGQPTSYWFDRLVSPNIYTWPVADQVGVYTINYYAFRRLQDMDAVGGQAGDIQYRFLEAFTAALAAHLAIKWAPDRAAALLQYADRMWTEAAEADREVVPLRISPNFGSYFH